MSRLSYRALCVVAVAATALLGLPGCSSSDPEASTTVTSTPEEPSASGEGRTEVVTREDWEPFFEAGAITGWAYQELAREVGDERMQQWVTAAAHGNESIGGSIDSFWLDGDLRISALEQVDFLTRFESGELPFRTETVDSVREILVQESGPDWSWSYKTGLSVTADPDLGWLVGTVNNGTSSWVFALNLDIEQADGPPELTVRQMVTRKLLEAEGVLPTP